MKGIEYDSDIGIARVLPGTRWHSVYTFLDQSDVGVAGGRLGHVGVGGLLTGGGCSHYMYQVGFACDNVVGFEIVLASGQVIEASDKEHADLWQSLKGGGRVFGVITRFDLHTFPAPPIWGGSQSHGENATEAYIPALKHWTDNIENYPAGSAVIFWSYRLIERETLIIAGMADTSGKIEQPAFEEIRSIPSKVTNEMTLTNMSTMSLATQAAGLRLVPFNRRVCTFHANIELVTSGGL
jgi:FAD/FMN-containing dehydrogenase